MSDPRPEDDEPDYESVSDISEINPEDKLFAPAQQKIESQLRQQLQEVTQQLHEIDTEFSRATKEREDCGVDLYNAQQHLAKLQEQLEKQHEKLAEIQQQHEEKQEERNRLTDVTNATQKNVDDMKKQESKFQDQLAKLTETLIKVDNYNAELKSEVEIERRAAHKTEVDITHLEREKLRQDSLISSLQDRTAFLENQSALLKEQYQSQKKETQAARDTLAEAMNEMEAVNFEKKQLVQQWKSSLIGMQRRHDALKMTEEALDQQKADLQVLENEIAGFRRDIRDTQTENAKLTEFMSRIENEITVRETQMDQLIERREQNAETYALMKNTVEQNEAESKLLEQQVKAKSAELASLQKDIANESKAIVDMEGKLLEYLNNQTTLKQESQGALHDIEKIKATIRAKELHITQTENELARIRLDTLQSKAFNETLQDTLTELEKELESRNVMIQRMQSEIRHRNDEIDRKQKQLDVLNHQYDQVLRNNGGGGEHVGPLEATINSLSKTIAAKSDENEAMQQEWIKLQAELVSYKNTMNNLNEAILDSDRLLEDINKEKQEIASLEKKADSMHLEMKRVNTLLSHNATSKEVVANDAFLLESDLMRRLEEKNRAALQLQRRVEDTRKAKAEVFQQVMDCERDIMFWERKLQISRETEMALDPTVGKAEIQKMKKEIAFMEQRVAQLEREHKFLKEEMVRLVERRDIIRAKGKSAEGNNKRGISRNQLEKENARLFKELAAKREESQAKERAIKENLAEVERTAQEVDRTQNEIANIDVQLEALKNQLNSANKERARAEDEKRLKQNSLQRLREGESGTYKLSCYPEDAANETERLENGRRTAINIIEELANQFPDLSGELQELMTTV
eukprot:gene12861-8742_t